MARVQRVAKGRRIPLSNSVTNVVIDTEKEVGAIEEVTAEDDFITISLKSQKLKQ